MARKKSNNIQPSQPIELIVTRDDAEARLRERIQKGLEIKELLIDSQPSFEQARKEYYKWNDFNTELLRRIFSTIELSDEYSFFCGGFISIGEKSLSDYIHDLHDDINEKIHRLESITERLELIPIKNNVEEKIRSTHTHNIDKSKVFIVHGHDDLVKNEVARFIEKMGFEPIILHEQASSSKTIIEKIETYSEVGFGIVLYTPCDVGGENIDHPELQGRARQNVVFEHGYLIGKLGRENVCQLVKGVVETPTDVSGIVYISMVSGSWQIELAKELRSSGYAVDMNKII